MISHVIVSHLFYFILLILFYCHISNHHSFINRMNSVTEITFSNIYAKANNDFIDGIMYQEI